jgi:hypothetical protein
MSKVEATLLETFLNIFIKNASLKTSIYILKWTFTKYYRYDGVFSHIWYFLTFNVI